MNVCSHPWWEVHGNECLLTSMVRGTWGWMLGHIHGERCMGTNGKLLRLCFKWRCLTLGVLSVQKILHKPLAVVVTQPTQQEQPFDELNWLSITNFPCRSYACSRYEFQYEFQQKQRCFTCTAPIPNEKHSMGQTVVYFFFQKDKQIN